MLGSKEHGILKGSRLLPFIIALIAIAVALGSLPRSQPDGSLLVNSEWLVYLVALIPVIGLGLVIAMIIFMTLHWRHISDAVGFQIARKKAASKKQSRTIQLIVWMAAWAVAGYIITTRCGGTGVLNCQASQSSPLENAVTPGVQGSAPISTLPLLSTIVKFSSLIQSNWFYIAFSGLLVLTAVIVGRGVFVSLKETRNASINMMPIPNSDGIAAVEDALQILRTHRELDARTRIIQCYERMIDAAQHQGAIITQDQTARELEASVRKLLTVKGPAVQRLTNLFEEARYSLHPITERDAQDAEKHLLEISEEIHLPLQTLN